MFGHVKNQVGEGISTFLERPRFPRTKEAKKAKQKTAVLLVWQGTNATDAQTRMKTQRRVLLSVSWGQLSLYYKRRLPVPPVEFARTTALVIFLGIYSTSGGMGPVEARRANRRG